MNKGEVPPASEWGGHRRGGGRGAGPARSPSRGSAPRPHWRAPTRSRGSPETPGAGGPQTPLLGNVAENFVGPGLTWPWKLSRSPAQLGQRPRPHPPLPRRIEIPQPAPAFPCVDPDRPPGQPSCLRAGFLEAAALPHWSGSPWGHSLLGSPTIHVWKDCAQCPVCPNDQACQGRRDQPDAQPGPGGDPCAHCCVSRGTWWREAASWARWEPGSVDRPGRWVFTPPPASVRPLGRECRASGRAVE